MIGSTNTLIDKKGGLIHPHIETKFTWEKLPAPSFNSYNCELIDHNDCIFMTGGSNGNTLYKWDGSKWAVFTTNYYYLDGGKFFTYNDIICEIGGSGSYGTYVYTLRELNGLASDWVDHDRLPLYFYNGEAVVYDGKIHLLGGTNSTMHYSTEYYSALDFISIGTLPYQFTKGAAIVYKGEIHIFGSSVLENSTKHYKWNGTSWSEASILPMQFYGGKAVVYDDKIHLVGNAIGDQKTHYTWDGTSWEKLDDLPYNFYNGGLVEFKNQLYILGSSDTASYKNFYRGEMKDVFTVNLPQNAKVITESTTIPANATQTDYGFIVNTSGEFTFSVPRDVPVTIVNNKSVLYCRKGNSKVNLKLPYKFYYGECVEYQGDIHILGGNESINSHYKWNHVTGEWSYVSTIPEYTISSNPIIFNNEIHIAAFSNTEKKSHHYKWNGNEWKLASTFPYPVNACRFVIYNDELHMLGSYISPYGTSHYKWDGTTWTSVSTLPETFYSGHAIVYDGKIHIIGGGLGSYSAYRWEGGNSWVQLPRMPFRTYYGFTYVEDNKLHVIETVHSIWDGEKWFVDTEPQYGLENSCGLVYKGIPHALGCFDVKTVHVVLDGEKWHTRLLVKSCKLDNNMKVNGELINSNIIEVSDDEPITIEY